MIVLRSPEGLDRAGRGRRRSRSTGTWRSHQVPLSGVRDNPEHLRDAGGAGCGRTGPRSCSTRTARPAELVRGRQPDGRAADERHPARQRRPAHPRPRPARLPRLRGRRSPQPATERAESTRQLGELMRDIYRRNPDTLPAVLPGRDQQQPARRGLRGLRPGLHGAGRPPTTSDLGRTAG